MKKTVLAASIALLSSLSMAVTPVTIPWSNSFEGISGDITNYDAWSVDANATAIITNIGSYASQLQTPPKVKYPLNDATHTNVLYFTDVQAGLSNTIDGTDKYTVWLDTMIQPVRSETPPSDAVVSNSQLSLYFDTNGCLNVYHGFHTNAAEYQSVSNHTNGWTKLTDAFPSVDSNKWIRLTILMSYQNPSPFRDLVMFTIMINGKEFSDSSGYSTNDLELATPSGPWFVAANWIDRKISQLVLQGSGKVDDMVITDSPVSVDLAGITVLSVVMSGKGTISPAGSIDFSTVPASTNYQITASNYWYIANIYTGAMGGVSSGTVVAAQGTNDYSLAFSAGADSYVNVYFAPVLVGDYATPSEWLSNYGLPTGTDTNDSDADGLSDGQEYVAGTVPNNSNSVLRILSETISGGSVEVQWQAAAGSSGNGRLYSLESTSNLVAAAWMGISNNLTSTGTGTNSLTLSAPSTTPTIYRVNATNTASW